MPWKWLPRIRVTHTGFVLAFPTLLYLVCNGPNLGKLSRWFQGTDGLEVLPFLAYLVGALCLFIAVFALLAHRWTIKPVAALLTVTGGAATYFIAKYDVAIDSSMVLNTLHTDATEVGQLLSWGMLPFALFMIIAVTLIWSAQIGFAASGRYLLSSLVVFLASLTIALVALLSNFNAIHRAGNVSNKYIAYSLVPINLISGTVSATSKAIGPLFQPDPAEMKVEARVTRPGDLVVVLAIGESSRRKNFSVYGYARRNTTPRLREIDGLHLLAGNATRGSTIYALRQILEKDGVKLPLLVSRAGVPTACYVNYTLYDNCAGVGEVKTRDCGHAGKCFDEDVLPLLRHDLAAYQGGYRFVVLHLGGGSHGPLYANRHPPEFLRFKPTCDDADVTSHCSMEQLYNSYDNTVLYVDHVVAESIRALDEARVPYVFVYLSDHGESLMEDGRLFHGMPPGVSLPAEQAEIPLIVKSSVPLEVEAREVYRQPDVFDTVLSLFSIQSPGFDRAGSFLKVAD